MEGHPNPFSSPDTPRLPPPQLHRRVPSRSPTRNRLSITDDIFRDFAPARIFEAFNNPSGRLKASIEAASPADRAFGHRAALASRNIQEWVHELQIWEWPDEGGSFGFEPAPPKRSNVSQHGRSKNGNEDLQYIGSLLASTVVEYEAKIDQIHADLEDLDVEGLKRHVLDNHFAPDRPSSSSSNVSSTPVSSCTKLEDFTAIVTATVLRALPNLGRLMRLMDVWSIRLSVLRRVPKLLRLFEENEVALSSGWKAIHLPTEEDLGISEEQTLSRDSFDVMKNVLQDKVTTLGRNLDYMLDTLEGKDDTLPDKWLDRMEAIEKDYGEWAVAGDRKVREGEWAKLAKIRKQQEEEAKRATEEVARLKAEQDAKHAESEARQRESERRIQEIEAARLKAEEDARYAESEARKLKEQQETQVAARMRAEQDAKDKETKVQLETERKAREAERVHMQSRTDMRLSGQKAGGLQEEQTTTVVVANDQTHPKSTVLKDKEQEVHHSDSMNRDDLQFRSEKQPRIVVEQHDHKDYAMPTSKSMAIDARTPTLALPGLKQIFSSPTHQEYDDSRDAMLESNSIHDGHAIDADAESGEEPSTPLPATSIEIKAQLAAHDFVEHEAPQIKEVSTAAAAKTLEDNTSAREIDQLQLIEDSTSPHIYPEIPLREPLKIAQSDITTPQGEQKDVSAALVNVPHIQVAASGDPSSPVSQIEATSTFPPGTVPKPLLANQSSTLGTRNSANERTGESSIAEEFNSGEQEGNSTVASAEAFDLTESKAAITKYSIQEQQETPRHGSQDPASPSLGSSAVSASFDKRPSHPSLLRTSPAFNEDTGRHNARMKALETAERERAEVARLRVLLEPGSQEVRPDVKRYLTGQISAKPSVDGLERDSASDLAPLKTQGSLGQEDLCDICTRSQPDVFMSFDGAADTKPMVSVSSNKTENKHLSDIARGHVSALRPTSPSSMNNEAKIDKINSSSLAEQALTPKEGVIPELHSAGGLLGQLPNSPFEKVLDSEMVATSSEEFAPLPTSAVNKVPPVEVIGRKIPSDNSISHNTQSSEFNTAPLPSVVYSPETGTFTYLEPASIVENSIESQLEVESEFSPATSSRTGYSTVDATPEVLEAEPAHYFRPVISPIKSARSSVVNTEPSTPTSPISHDLVADGQGSSSHQVFQLPLRSPARLAKREIPGLPSRSLASQSTSTISAVDGATESVPTRDVELEFFQQPALARKTSITRINSPAQISVQRRDSSSSNSTIVNTARSSPLSPIRRQSSPFRPSTPPMSSASSSFQDDLSPSIRRHRNGRSHDYTSPDSPPPIPRLVNGSPVSPRAFNNSFSSTSLDSTSPKTPVFEIEDHTPSPIASPRKGNTDEQMQQQISTLLESIPARIRLTTETGSSPVERLNVKKTRRSAGPTFRPSSTMSNHSRSATPSFTLAPAHGNTQPRQRAQNGNPEIKVYHLSRSTGEAPIKLFVRLVGENGERVMVRVGGGWADLGEYLKEYASHHGRRAAANDGDKVEIQDLPPRVVSGSSTLTTALRGDGRSTPTQRPASSLSRPLSSLAIRKTRKSVGDSLDPPSQNTSFRSPSTPMPSSLSRSYGSSAYETPPSHPNSVDRSSSRMSWTEEDSSLGLAGPKSKKVVISEKDQEWVESMKEKVRQASAEKERRNRGREASLGEMDRVGGTKRLFRKA